MAGGQDYAVLQLTLPYASIICVRLKGIISAFWAPLAISLLQTL